MAIFRKRMQEDMEQDDAGQRLAHVSHRADHYRKLVATPSVLLAAGLFTVSGIAGGFLATGQSAGPITAVAQPAALPPVAVLQPVIIAPLSAPVVEEVANAPVELPPAFHLFILL